MSNPSTFECFDNCGSAHGLCNLSSVTCDCEYPWVNLGDFVPSPDLTCNINWEVAKILWAVSLGLHVSVVAAIILALIFARRGTKSRVVLERSLLLIILCGFSAGLALTILELTAVKPGDRSVGTDLATTLLYIVSELVLSMHAIYLPFVQTGTSMLPFALDSNPFLRTKQYSIQSSYSLIALLLVTSQLLVLGILFDPTQVLTYIHVSFAFAFVVVMTTGLFTLYVVWSLLINVHIVTSTLNANELTPEQKTGLETTRKRAIKLKWLIIIVLVVSAPQFLIFTVAPRLLLHAGWAWVPLRKILVVFVELRHPYLSLITSLSHYRKQMHRDDPSNTDDHNNNNNGGVDNTKIGAVTQLKTSTLLLGIGKKPTRSQKNRILTRVEEERTIDVRTSVQANDDKTTTGVEVGAGGLYF